MKKRSAWTRWLVIGLQIPIWLVGFAAFIVCRAASGLLIWLSGDPRQAAPMRLVARNPQPEIWD